MRHLIKIVFLIFGALLAGGCGQKDPSAEQSLASRNTESVQSALEGYWINDELAKQIERQQSLARAFRVIWADINKYQLGSEWKFISPTELNVNYGIGEGTVDYPYEQDGRKLIIKYRNGDNTSVVSYLIESSLICGDKEREHCMRHLVKVDKGLAAIDTFSYEKLLQGSWQDVKRKLAINFKDDGTISGLPSKFAADTKGFTNQLYKLNYIVTSGDTQVIARTDGRQIKSQDDLEYGSSAEWSSKIELIDSIYIKPYDGKNSGDVKEMSFEALNSLAFKRHGDSLELFLIDAIGAKGEKPTYVTGKLIFSGKLLKSNDRN